MEVAPEKDNDPLLQRVAWKTEFPPTKVVCISNRNENMKRKMFLSQGKKILRHYLLSALGCAFCQDLYENLQGLYSLTLNAAPEAILGFLLSQSLKDLK